jgi:p-cumate 2,3-dioxygenase ferredoxin component
MSWLYVSAVRELLPGEMRRVDTDEFDPIAVYNVNGTYYATEDTCSHGAASLVEDGYLDQASIECGMHMGTFDVTTGEPTGMPCTIPLKRFATKVEDDVVYVSTEPA